MFRSFWRRFRRRGAGEQHEATQNSERLTEARTHYEKSLRYHDSGELELARDEIARANEIDLGYAGSFGYLGQAYENRGELAKAARADKEFLKLGNANQNRGRFDQVLEKYPVLLATLEKRELEQTARGHLSADQQTALFLSPTNLHLFACGLVSISGIEKDTEVLRSVTIPTAVAEWAIPFAERIQQAEGLFAAGKIMDALAQFKELWDSVPDSAIVLMNIGVCYAEIGNKQVAASWRRKALLSAPGAFRDRVEANSRRLNLDS